MINVKTTFTPFKMKISRREPVTLSVELENDGQETEIVSLELRLGSLFSLEKTGFKTDAGEKIPKFEPGQKKKFYYDIWPKQMVRPGEHEIRLDVIEHYKGFNYIKRKQEKRLRVSVEQ
jgi:uncharacterized membrane protein